MPGWKQEMTYSNKALVGNWYERRFKKIPGKLDFSTSNGEQFKGQARVSIFDVFGLSLL